MPAIGFVVTTVAVLGYHQERGELPMTPFGFRLMETPWSEIGMYRLTPLGQVLALLLIAVSIVDVLIGVWLWQGRPRGAVLTFVMAPVSLALGIVFALPYLIAMAPLRAIAAGVGWLGVGPAGGR